MFLGHIDLNFWKFQTFVLIRVSQSWKVIFDRWSATYENIRQVALPFECWFSNSSQTFTGTHFPDKKKCLKAKVLWITQQICQNLKKRLNFKERAVSVSQIIEIVRQRGFEGCKNCPGIWMPCISEQKVRRLGEDQH